MAGRIGRLCPYPQRLLPLSYQSIHLCLDPKHISARCPLQFNKLLGCKTVVGMPFKDIATADSILMRSLPPASDAAGRRVLRRLQVTCRCLAAERATAIVWRCIPAA